MPETGGTRAQMSRHTKVAGLAAVWELAEGITNFSAPYKVALHPYGGKKNMQGIIDAECHGDAGSETMTSHVGRPDGGWWRSCPRRYEAHMRGVRLTVVAQARRSRLAGTVGGGNSVLGGREMGVGIE